MSPRPYELSDFERSIIQLLLPNKPPGVPRADDRKVLNRIDWPLEIGSPWADIHERTGRPRLREPVSALDQDRCVGPHFRLRIPGL